MHGLCRRDYDVQLSVLRKTGARLIHVKRVCAWREIRDGEATSVVGNGIGDYVGLLIGYGNTGAGNNCPIGVSYHSSDHSRLDLSKSHTGKTQANQHNPE